MTRFHNQKELFRKIRKATGLSQREVAVEECGYLSGQMAANIESDKPVGVTEEVLRWMAKHVSRKVLSEALRDDALLDAELMIKKVYGK